MTLEKHYKPSEIERQLEAFWQEEGIYHFDPNNPAPVFSIDTPPPTVSGNLHLGHCYSYSHVDFIARFYRMNGYNVFYPMGYDDNGLPTERLVEKRLKITAPKVGRAKFIESCLQVSEDAEKDYRALWQRLGLSVDWRYSYRTIDDFSRRTSQRSFLELLKQGLAYRKSAPAIWCPECRTSIAQAELNDLDRQSEFVTLPFTLPDGRILSIATTRPELLCACVAIFVHPQDARYQNLLGAQATVPFYGQLVNILPDPAADPNKGTGAVMCCTFGDQTDVSWWYTHNLPLIEAIDRQGTMTAVSGPLAGLSIPNARQKIKEILSEQGLILDRTPTSQSVRVHERCDTPVEFIQAQQWFVHILKNKELLLSLGEQIQWHPEPMSSRYQSWVENLNWDWCISRQRFFGVPFPVWYCASCGEVITPAESELPIDPLASQPGHACPRCGSTEFKPEEDVMDTWATSSLSPQIVGQYQKDPALYQKVYPFSLRPQAHEIIRTWAFYTLVKNQYHFQQLPWQHVLISGWGLAGEGMGKISKSRGGGPMAPMQMIERYSADGVRYWAASTSPGKDSVISEDKISAGIRLAVKLWNVARFCEPFFQQPIPEQPPASLTPADRWILSRLQNLIQQVTRALNSYEYAIAKSEIEAFFWKEVADNYLEMVKQRLYAPETPDLHTAAIYTLHHLLLTLIKLFAPFLPYVTEAIYRELYATVDGCRSIHRSAWPQADPQLQNPQAEALGELLVQIAVSVRRYKSEQNLSLGSELAGLVIETPSAEQQTALALASADLMSITRARCIRPVACLSPDLIRIDGPIGLSSNSEAVKIGLEPLRESNPPGTAPG